MILLPFTLLAAASALMSPFPEKLLCNRLTGNFVTCCGLGPIIQFGRPLEPGDKIIINGTVGPAAGFKFLRINILDSSQSITSFRMRTKLSTDRPIDYTKVIYNALFNNRWGAIEYGPNPFVNSAPTQITIQYTGAGYIVYSGNVLIKNFALRHSAAVQLMYLELSADFSTNWVEMDCVRPLATTALPTTPRRGHEHGHGNGHGNHHGGGGKGSSSSSGSSSQEFCD